MTKLSDANAVKTHCLRGHEFTPANTYLYRGRGKAERRCRRCRTENRAPAKKAEAPKMEAGELRRLRDRWRDGVAKGDLAELHHRSDREIAALCADIPYPGKGKTRRQEPNLCGVW